MIDSQDKMNWVGSNGEYDTTCGTYSACRSDDYPGKWMLAVRRGNGPEKDRRLLQYSEGSQGRGSGHASALSSGLVACCVIDLM